MDTIRLALLRGVCQLPAYVAAERGFLEDEGIEARLSIAPTAWAVPERMTRGEVEFAVIPWTRVAADRGVENRLVLVAGSGIEEAAMVVRAGLDESEVRRVAVPQEGGIKDLTAMALLERMGWRDVEIVRMPSGDGAILAFVGEGADAASMVEPYAAMLEHLGLGRVVRRTGDVWPGAPGCSLTTTSRVIAERPELVERMVRAYLRGARFVAESPEEAARVGARFIGVGEHVVRRALEANRPDPNALRNEEAMAGVLELMAARGYVDGTPEGYLDLSFLDRAELEVSLAAAVPPG
jgi:ABC-type nitrate/sulfonate/bicarbonate transport system substrate-binding protein